MSKQFYPAVKLKGYVIVTEEASRTIMVPFQSSYEVFTKAGACAAIIFKHQDFVLLTQNLLGAKTLARRDLRESKPQTLPGKGLRWWSIELQNNSC